MSELLNPLQIAGRLKKQPAIVVKVIVQNDIAAHKEGLRAGLYDFDEVQAALSRYEESQKKPLADKGHEMKSLPEVTLISYDNSADPTRTLKALQHCASLIAFADVILCCSVNPSNKGDVFATPVEATGYRGAMEWEVFGLNEYVDTDYALCIHHDGYIINPDMWRDYWLDYDFIGAPWPHNPHPLHPGKASYPGRVGNTGFCLKSKAFMQETAALRDSFVKSYGTDQHGQTLGGDTFTSQHQRSFLESQGIKFAPVEAAADFSWESSIEEYPRGRSDAFGFHSFALENKQVVRL